MRRYNNGIIYGKKGKSIFRKAWWKHKEDGKRNGLTQEGKMAMGSYFLRLSGQNIHIYYSAYFCKHWKLLQGGKAQW